MSTFLSLVGLQPSAPALALKSWCRWKTRPGRVVLLTTQRTTETAARIASLFPELRFETHRIGSYVGAQERSHLQELLRPLLQDDLIFFADSGLNAHVALVARTLSTSHPHGATYLHADDQFLHRCRATPAGEQWDHHELQNLGLDALAQLYGIHIQAGVAVPAASADTLARAGLDPAHLPARLRPDVRIATHPHVRLDLAYESKGRLFALASVQGGDELRSARDVEQLALGAGALRARVAVVSTSSKVLSRLAAHGYQTINPAQPAGLASLREWIAGRPAALARLHHPHSSPSDLPSPARGSGGDGPDLAVCLGSDASATLVSLATHRPQRVRVYADTGTEIVRKVSHRLAAACAALPVGEVTFEAVDHLGRRARPQLQDSSAAARIADITPGTKAQTCALARALDRELWAIHGDLGTASSLMGETSTPLAAPPVAVQARVVGGELLEEGESADTFRANARLFSLLIRFLAAWSAEQPLERRGLPAGLESLACARGTLTVARNVVTVTLDAQTARGTVSTARLKSGTWFEPVVAHALLQAGCDDLRVGVKWDWPGGYVVRLPGGRLQRYFKDEVDVVARLGHRFLAVSCKAGLKVPVEKERRQIEAVAAHGVGRLSVPVLVRIGFGLDRTAVERSALDPSRALLLDAAALAEPPLLARTLATALEHRSRASGEEALEPLSPPQ